MLCTIIHELGLDKQAFDDVGIGGQGAYFGDSLGLILPCESLRLLLHLPQLTLLLHDLLNYRIELPHKTVFVYKLVQFYVVCEAASFIDLQLLGFLIWLLGSLRLEKLEGIVRWRGDSGLFCFWGW